MQGRRRRRVTCWRVLFCGVFGMKKGDHRMDQVAGGRHRSIGAGNGGGGKEVGVFARRPFQRENLGF